MEEKETMEVLRECLAAARDEAVAEDKRYCEALEYIARLDEQWQAAEARAAAEGDRAELTPAGALDALIDLMYSDSLMQELIRIRGEMGDEHSRDTSAS